MHVRQLALYAVLAASVLTPHRAEAYCLTKYPTGSKWAAWPNQPIKYRISSNLTDAGIIAAIDKAFQTWAAAPCTKLSFTKDAAFPVTTPISSNTGYVSIYWVTKASELPSGMTANLYGYYFIGYDMTGSLNQASAAFNAFQFKWNTTGGAADTFDVQNVVTYYVGLLIGLGKSKTATALMYDNVTFGQTSKRTLTQDDINAVSAIYPSGTCAAPPPPDSACGVPPPPPPPPPPKDGGTTKVDTGKPPPPPPPPPPTERGLPRPDGTTVPVSETGVPIPTGDSAPPTTGCNSNSECKSGEMCSVDHQCLKTGGGGGCGCLVAGRPTTLPLLALVTLTLLGLLLIRARRKSV